MECKENRRGGETKVMGGKGLVVAGTRGNRDAAGTSGKERCGVVGFVAFH